MRALIRHCRGALDFALAMILSTPVLLATQNADVRLSVPVAAADIARLRVGGRDVAIRTRSTGPAKRIVMLSARGGRKDDALLGELSGAQRLCASCFDGVEIWSSFGQPSTTGVARFAEGWVGVIWRQPWQNPDSWLLQPLEAAVDIVEFISDRFVGSGPVEVYWLSDSFDWLDCRRWEDCRLSRIEEIQDKVGNAGLTLYPILTRLKGRSPGSLRFAKFMTGAEVRQAGSPQGAALAAALKEALTHTQISFSLKPSKPRWTRTPLLAVLDRSGRTLYRRPFLVADTTGRGASVDRDALANRLYRIVPETTVESATVGSACGEGAAPDAEEAEVRFLNLAGVKLASSDGESGTAARAFAVSVSRHDRRGGTMALVRRNEVVTWLQKGNTACVGPLQISGSTDFAFFEPKSGWAAFLRVRPK